MGFVRTAIQQKEADGKVAAAVQGIRLANRLDEKTVTDLQHAGAGPKTVAALEKLREASASLPAAAAAADLSPALPPAPSPAELKQLIAEVRENALHYTDGLPNYVCTQVTNRKVDPTGSESWRAVDQILERLTFFEQKESYKVMMVNSRPNTTDLTHDKLGGATSSGEFGSILHAIFAPETQTEFQWERWTGLRKRWAYVLSFETGQPMYTIQHGPSQKSVTVRVRGSIYADRDTKMVVRIKMEATAIPAGLPHTGGLAGPELRLHGHRRPGVPAAAAGRRPLPRRPLPLLEPGQLRLVPQVRRGDEHHLRCPGHSRRQAERAAAAGEEEVGSLPSAQSRPQMR